VYPTGVAGTSALGSVGLITVNVIAVTQSAMTSALGSITAVGHANIALTGLYGTGEITNLLIWGLVDDSQTPNYSEVSSTQTPGWEDVAA